MGMGMGRCCLPGGSLSPSGRDAADRAVAGPVAGLRVALTQDSPTLPLSWVTGTPVAVGAGCARRCEHVAARRLLGGRGVRRGVRRGARARAPRSW